MNNYIQFVNLIRAGQSKWPLVALAGVSLILLSSCNSSTVLMANFKYDSVGSPPGAVQPTGTVSLNPGSGSITVVDAPKAGLPLTRWALISHPVAPAPETMLRGKFAQSFNTVIIHF